MTMDNIKCPECGSYNYKTTIKGMNWDGTPKHRYICNDCGHVWNDE